MPRSISFNPRDLEIGCTWPLFSSHHRQTTGNGAVQNSSFKHACNKHLATILGSRPGHPRPTSLKFRKRRYCLIKILLAFELFNKLMTKKIQNLYVQKLNPQRRSVLRKLLKGRHFKTTILFSNMQFFFMPQVKSTK